VLGDHGQKEERLRHYRDDKRSSKQQRSESPKRGYFSGQCVHEVINTIAGGLACGECSSSTCKKLIMAIKSIHSTTIKDQLRIPLILFTDDDFTVINPAHDDPMVITGKIEKFLSSRFWYIKVARSTFYTRKLSKK